MIEDIITSSRRLLRWGGITVGATLLAVEGLDAVLTPRPDWFWFGASVLLIALCWNITQEADTRR